MAFFRQGLHNWGVKCSGLRVTLPTPLMTNVCFCGIVLATVHPPDPVPNLKCLALCIHGVQNEKKGRVTDWGAKNAELNNAELDNEEPSITGGGK